MTIAKILQAAGLPNGVFSLVQGDKAAVDPILAHRVYRKLDSAILVVKATENWVRLAAQSFLYPAF